MKKTVKLQDLDCANCAAKIESAVSRLEGVTGVTVNFLRQKMELEAPDDKFESVLDSAVKIIRKIEPDVTVEF
jgi:copper chaperone CopZ